MTSNKQIDKQSTQVNDMLHLQYRLPVAIVGAFQAVHTIYQSKTIFLCIIFVFIEKIVEYFFLKGCFCGFLDFDV